MNGSVKVCKSIFYKKTEPEFNVDLKVTSATKR